MSAVHVARITCSVAKASRTLWQKLVATLERVVQSRERQREVGARARELPLWRVPGTHGPALGPNSRRRRRSGSRHGGGLVSRSRGALDRSPGFATTKKGKCFGCKTAFTNHIQFD